MFSQAEVSAVSFLQCFDTVGWVTGKPSGLQTSAGLGFVSLGPFHCASIHFCVCILCITVLYVVVL